MACESLVGVKNILITFTDCQTDEVIRKVSHELSSEDLPMVRTCDYTNERLPGGYTKRQHADARITMKVIRNLGVPLSYYQGCAAVDVQIEYDNGLVYTGLNGGVIGDNDSDTHEVEMEMTFRILDELLPPNAAAELEAA